MSAIEDVGACCRIGSSGQEVFLSSIIVTGHAKEARHYSSGHNRSEEFGPSARSELLANDIPVSAISSVATDGSRGGNLSFATDCAQCFQGMAFGPVAAMAD